MKPIDGKDLEADLLAEILEKDHESARYGAMVENGTMTSRDVAYMQGYMHGLEFGYTKVRTARSIEKHGYWVEIKEPNGGEETPAAMCSECNESWVLGEWTIDEVRSEFKFCPWCGARMLEVEDETD